MTEPVKSCTKCGEALPLCDFYPHPKMKDGHLSRCKSCTKDAVKQNYHAKIEEKHAWERERRQRPERKVYQYQQVKLYRELHADRNKARQRLGYHVRKGNIKRLPCEVCGTSEQVQAHHEDYSRPLDVRWMCFRCHRQHGHGQKPS